MAQIVAENFFSMTEHFSLDIQANISVTLARGINNKPDNQLTEKG